MPENAKKTAVAAEAENASTTIEHGGIEYTIPPFKEIPMQALLADNEVQLVSLILGKAQWEKFCATEPTIGDFQEMSEKVNDASGN
ncbi:hypothetical protein ACFQ71_03030 [Streptomyces sp. NPDC056534]|uniref:hypothetical protein n=1 Tax=Streptomyces sp. NPDC056534 TaxID=3345857 RepID=UPI0036C257CD